MLWPFSGECLLDGRCCWAFAAIVVIQIVPQASGGSSDRDTADDFGSLPCLRVVSAINASAASLLFLSGEKMAKIGDKTLVCPPQPMGMEGDSNVIV